MNFDDVSEDETFPVFPGDAVHMEFLQQLVPTARRNNRIELTEGLVRELKHYGSSTVYDTEMRNLMVVTREGRRQYYAIRTKDGPRKYIGETRNTTLMAARGRASELYSRELHKKKIVPTPRRASNPTIKALMDAYLTHAAKNLSPKWRKRVHHLIRSQIVPGIGHWRAEDCTTLDFQDWFDERASVSQSNAADLRRVLSAALTWARDNLSISTNAVLATRPPPTRLVASPESEEDLHFDLLSIDDLAILVSYAANLIDPWDKVVKLWLMTGQKLTHVLGFELEYYEHANGSWIVDRNENPFVRSHRVIVPECARELIKSVRQNRDCRFLFPSPRMKSDKPLSRRSDLFPALTWGTGLKINPKIFERSMQTILLNEGLSPADVAITLNHRKLISLEVTNSSIVDLSPRTKPVLEVWNQLLFAAMEKNRRSIEEKRNVLDEEVTL